MIQSGRHRTKPYGSFLHPVFILNWLLFHLVKFIIQPVTLEDEMKWLDSESRNRRTTVQMYCSK